MDLPLPPKKTELTLSAALRKGCGELPQERGHMTWHFQAKLCFSWTNPDKNKYTLCSQVTHTTALGAVLLAVYPADRIIWESGAVLEELARRTYPCLAQPATCPVRYEDRPQPEDETTLLGVVKALNDRYGWDMERIAAWVETQMVLSTT